MVQNFSGMSNEITKSCQGSLSCGHDMKQGPTRFTAWSSLFGLCVISNNKNTVAYW